MTRRVRWIAALLVVVCASAGAAWADEDGVVEKEPPAGESSSSSDDLKADDLENQILAHDGAKWALIVGRLLPILIGVVLLILFWLRWDKIRGGALPRPPTVEPTLAFGLGEGLMWSVTGLIVGPTLLIVLLSEGQDLESLPAWKTIVAMAVCTVAVSILFLVRRSRMQGTAPDGVQWRFGPNAPIPTQPPAMGRALGIGAWTYCVASLCVIPIAMAWALLLSGLGTEPVAQEPVRDVLDKSSDTGPILMAFFGIVIAPFTEECIFRGMLYPAVKRVFGGGRRAAWLGALIVSAVFAAVHWNLYAAVPLFVLALVLNWVFEKTNSLAAVIVAHALHNGITMIPLLILRYAP